MSKEKKPIFGDDEQPIDNDKYTLFTPMIHESIEFLEDALLNRESGAIVFGTPRYGKSKTIEFLTDYLIQKFDPEFPVFTIDMEFTKTPSEKRTWKALLSGVNHAIGKRGDIDEIKGRLVTFVVQRAKKAGHRAVFFLDESQHLREAHYLWLLSFQNALTKAGVTPLFLLYGTQELAIRRNTFIEYKKGHIVGRFMVSVYHFHGIRDVLEMETCLGGYDQTPVVDGSEWTFTRYYLEPAYELGWRMESEAGKAWEAFCDALSSAKMTMRNEGIGMKYFARTVEYLFRNYSSIDVSFEGFSKKQWAKAVEKSKYTLSEQCIGGIEDID
jgi:hypothetical protein